MPGGTATRLETAPFALKPTVRPSEDQIIGRDHMLRPRTTMKDGRDTIGGIERSQDPDVVSGCKVMLRKSLDVPRNAPRVSPGVGRHQGDAHLPHGTCWIGSAKDFVKTMLVFRVGCSIYECF